MTKTNKCASGRSKLKFMIIERMNIRKTFAAKDFEKGIVWFDIKQPFQRWLKLSNGLGSRLMTKTVE